MNADHVDSEIELLREKILELGSTQNNGQMGIKFGELYEKTVDIFEAINGTLRAAKRKKIINFEGQMLLKGAHDNVIIYLVQE